MTKKLKINTNTVRTVLDEIKAISATTYSDDDDRMYAIKMAVESLSDKDKCVLALLLEHGSQRALSKVLGCSPSLVNQMIQSIRKQIKDAIS